MALCSHLGLENVLYVHLAQTVDPVRALCRIQVQKGDQVIVVLDNRERRVDLAIALFDSQERMVDLEKALFDSQEQTVDLAIALFDSQERMVDPAIAPFENRAQKAVQVTVVYHNLQWPRTAPATAPDRNHWDPLVPVVLHRIHLHTLAAVLCALVPLFHP